MSPFCGWIFVVNLEIATDKIFQQRRKMANDLGITVVTVGATRRDRYRRFIPLLYEPPLDASQPHAGRWHDSYGIGTVLAIREKLSRPFTTPQRDPLSLSEPSWTTGAMLSRILWGVTEKWPPLDVRAVQFFF